MKKVYHRAMAIVLAGTTLLGAGLWHKSHRIAADPAKTAAQKPDALPTGVSEATLADIRSSLEKQEYHISYDGKKKKLQSPNRNNNIRAYYEPGKLTVQTRVDTTGEGFQMELINEGIFADGKLLYKPEADANANHHENKVQISHDAFTEEFINNEDGVRQNFIVENAPEGTRQLQVKMSAKGLKVEQGSGNELRFYSEKAGDQTRNKLVYSDLKCWDANKKPLNATLAYVDNRIHISVDVADAAYPVTIDPIIANGTPLNADKILQINQSTMWLGWSVSSAGDVDGDGYSDVIVGAPQYDLGEDNEGGAFVYKGSASGLTLTAVIFQSNQKDAKMGYSVSTAGDFNGDGFSDVIVGIPYYDKDLVDEGRANLYLGSANFFAPQASITAYGINGGEAGALMGINVATAGDIDGDGFSDILMAATKASVGGLVRCYKGKASGTPSAFGTLQINQPGAQFGYSVAPAGDIDADGYSDIIVGARWYTNGQGQDAEGAAFIYRGGSNGLQPNPTIIEGNQYNAAMGNKVSSAGDVNGDGYSDVLIGAYLYDVFTGVSTLTDAGVVNLYLGSPTGIKPQPELSVPGKNNDHMGSSIACAGDVNGDGYSDILLGAEFYDNGQFNEGGVFVFHGSKNGVVGDPASTLESNQGDGWFGTAVASAGDVNGDGYSDILIGCYTYDDGQKDEGLVFVYNGSVDGIGTKDAVTLTGSAGGSLMGASVASAGDVNSDGFDDVIVGAPDYDYNGTFGGIAVLYYGSINGIDPGNKLVLSKNKTSGLFGCSVAAAGDVDGNGFGDIIIGAKGYTNGENFEGVAFIYYGSNSGINAAAGQLIEKNNPSARFGASVSGGGDINKDGYSDIVIGAPHLSIGQEAIHIYYGSANGPVNPVTIQIPGGAFGSAVSIAGDINGDGYSDVVAGAFGSSLGQSDEGAVYIFHGAAGGISTTGKVLQVNQASAHLGIDVASAGDVNADGFGDIVVGADRYNGNGAAIIYYGSGSGINEVNPVCTYLDGKITNGNGVYANFGFSAKSAGDVNGDGYSDVIVGAYDVGNGQAHEGKAFVYHGSPSGIKPNASFAIESDKVDANLGYAVSGAGDVNGDGYSDIIVGAPHANSPLIANTGNATIYYGNNGKGLKNNVRLFNSDFVTPLSYSQFGQPNFVGSLFAKSFLGRNKGKFVWETAGPGVPFSKVGTNPITTSNLFTDMSGAPGDLSLAGSVIGASIVKTGIATKVRVRVRYSPVLAITGQMYGPWRYLQSQLAGYNNAPVPEEAMAETIKRKAEPEIETSVSFFPNPASDRLTIRVTDPSDIRAVRLYNTNGTPVYQSQRYEQDIDVSKLPGGIYILMLNRASGTPTSHRIVIRR